jgi:hypothetical protein
MLSGVRNGICCMSCLVGFGCASTQLNYNTLDVASTVQNVTYQQVLLNLSRTIDDPTLIPSQVDLAAGTIQTTNSLSPSFTAPLSKTVMQTGAGAITGFTTAGASSNVSVTDSWTQNWNISPITDANTLRNLRALYRYAVYGTDIRSEYKVPWKVNKAEKLVLNPYLLQQPHCVLCGNNQVPNSKLRRGAWLYWTNDPGVSSPENPPPSADVIDLGHYGHHELFMTRIQYQEGLLSDFILFLLPNQEPTAASSGSQGSSSRKPNIMLTPQTLPAPQ